MILRSKQILIELLLSICVCCHNAAPLGKIDRLIGAKYLEGLTESSSANEPIKVLRSTDRDIIIQIRRTPIKESPTEDLRDDKDVLDLSDDSVYNKHRKSKPKSVENHERDTHDNHFVGEDIVRDRISRLSMHKLPSNLKPFESKEYRFKDRNNPRSVDTDHKETVKERVSRLSMHKLPHNLNPFESKEFLVKDKKNNDRSLEERDHTKPHQEGSSHGNTNPANFEEDIKKYVILDMGVNTEDNGYDTESLYSHKRPKNEENKENKMNSTEHNFSDNRRNREGFKSDISLEDRGNKRGLNEGSSNISEHKSSLNEIDLKMQRKNNFEMSKEESDHQIQSVSKEADSANTPNSRKISLRTISFKRNDIMTTEKTDTSTKTTIIQDIKNKLNEGQNKLLSDQKEPLYNKIIKIRSPSLDSLQDLKRKFNIEHNKPSLLPGPSVLFPRKDALQRLQTYGARPRAPPKLALPPVYTPPNGQYYLQQPRTTEDPVLQAERTKTALQRMILFVNAMGKFDYYVSNAARNFVDLLTHHTHEYDDTIRSRYSGKHQDNSCGGEKDKRDEIADGDPGDDNVGYVRIRTSKTKRRNQEHDERTHSRNRDGTYSVSGEYGW